MAEYKHFDIETEQGASILVLNGPRLSETLIVSELQDELIAFVDSERPSRIVIDFSGVKHCSTAVINSLLRLKKRMDLGEEALAMCNMIDTIRDAYKVLRLDGTVFQIYDSREEALA